jgi:trk system potassium uptake protein TrkA
LARDSIVIVGGGLVGQTLAERLSADGRDVALVETDPQKVRELSETLDVHVIEGNGATVDMLRRAGAETAGLLVASTHSDEINLVAGMLATRVFKVPRLVVRLHDPGHDEGFRLLGEGQDQQRVSVNPHVASVDRIATLLEVPGAVDVVSFLGGELLVAGFKIRTGSDFAGLRVSDMQLLFAATPTLVVAIHRADRWIIPGGAELIEVGDLVYFAIERYELPDILSLVGVPKEQRKRIMVAGASLTGLALARRLEARDVRVTVVEADADRARRAAEELESALVIHGNVTDQALLEDEEIEGVSTFVAVTDDHETNLVAGLLARRLGAGRAFALVDNPALVALLEDTSIDAIISPRSLIIGLTLQIVRGRSVRSGAALLDDQVEIMEIEAAPGGRLTSGPLAKLGLPSGVLVAALQRGDKLVVPKGDDRIEEGDRVLLITTTDLARKVSDFLGA